MRPYTLSEKILLEEVTQCSKKMQTLLRGLSIGALIKTIRKQLGMSQKALAKRAGVPQSTVSHVEQGKRDVNLSTLQKILDALSCDLILAPVLEDSIDTLRHKQARKMAEKQIRYMEGTMCLEEQAPDTRFTEGLLLQEEERFLNGPNTKLWEE